MNEQRNNRLRIERRRRAWTQDDVVERMYAAARKWKLPAPKGLNANYVSRWERGVTHPSPHHVHLLCLAYELPSDRLGFMTESAPLDAEWTRGEDETKRREFLRRGVGAAITIGTALPPMTADAVTTLRRSLLIDCDALEANSASISDIEQLVGEAWSLRQSAQYGALADMILPLLRTVQDAVAQSRREPDTLRLLSSAVHAHNAASSLLRRLGAIELAVIAADRALQAANQSGDALLRAAAQHRLANVLLSGHQMSDAGEVALGAATRLEPEIQSSPAHLAMWGALLLTAAVAYARSNSATQAWGLFERARVASLWLGHDHVDLNSIFGPSNVAIHAVEIASDLGNTRAALEHSKRIDLQSLPPELLERRTTLLINMAVSQHHFEKDAAAALALLQQAERIAPEELRVDPKAHALIYRLMHDPMSRSAVRALADRLGWSD